MLMGVERPKSRLRFVLNLLVVLVALELTRELQQDAPLFVLAWAFIFWLPTVFVGTFVAKVINPMRLLRRYFGTFVLLYVVYQGLLCAMLTTHALK